MNMSKLIVAMACVLGINVAMAGDKETAVCDSSKRSYKACMSQITTNCSKVFDDEGRKTCIKNIKNSCESSKEEMIKNCAEAKKSI